MAAMTRTPRVLIAGAGIGGLTAALALLRAGIDCELYEQAPELREIGAGLQLAPNGTRVLFTLGLEQAIRRDGVETRDKVVRLWNDDREWSLYDPSEATPIERYGSPMFLMHRGDLHALLVAAVRQAKPDAIHLNAQCVGFEQDSTGVRLVMADGQQAQGDALIGADGVHSRIREALMGPASPKFTGIMAWRGLAPMEALPPRLRREVAAQWLGPTGHVTSYPVRRGTLLNMVGEIERADWQSESWVQHGERDECLRDFAGWHADLLDIIKTIGSFYKWGLFLREPLQQWSRGRVSLLGDACHATLPFLGQGANMAIEDGMILARAFQSSPDDPVAALRRYESVRVERAVNVVNRSAAMAPKLHNEALRDPASGAAFVTANFNRQAQAERVAWLYDYDPVTAPI